MNYQQTIEYLFSKLPMFSRIGAAAYKKDLSNTIALCEALGNPHRNIRTIHIAGTNGKGSVSHMLAAILQSAGYKTGLYTSPHFYDFRERIKITAVQERGTAAAGVSQCALNAVVLVHLDKRLADCRLLIFHEACGEHRDAPLFLAQAYLRALLEP